MQTGGSGPESVPIIVYYALQPLYSGNLLKPNRQYIIQLKQTGSTLYIKFYHNDIIYPDSPLYPR